MPKMCQFVDAVTRIVVYVNPATVRLVSPNPTNGTDIIFGDGHAITVAEQAENVVKNLDAAN